MSVKKSILSASALALAVTTVVGGTLAYNTAEDSDVNLQDSGYVDIVQHEYQRKDKTVSTNKKGETPELIPFVQGQSLYPAYANYDAAKKAGYGNPWTANQSDLMYWGDYVSGNSGVSEGAGNGLFEAKYLTGALDKFVFVENTGSSDCYFRTVIAFECPEGLTIGDASVDDIGTNVNSGYTWVENNGEQFTFTEIDGTRYAIAVGVYTGWNGGVLTPGETARPSLLQVAFSEKMTNEESKLFGDSYEILVYTQACQTENLGDDAVAALDTVFGKIDAENHPWIDYEVSEDVNADNAKDALTEDKSTIIVNLTGDITYDVAAWAANGMGGESTKNIIINGNGHTITFNQTDSDWNNIATTNDAVLTINDAHITNSGYNNGPWNRHDINFDCPVVLNNVTSDKAIALKDAGTFNNVTISDENTSDTYALWIQPNGQTVTLDGCTIDMIDCTDGRGIKIDEQYVANPAKVTLNVSDTTFKTEEKSAILVKSVAGADININDIDITNVAADTTNAVWVDEASSAYFDLVAVTGGYKVQE